MTDPKSSALDVPGGVLHYDIRAGADGTAPMEGT